MAFELDYAEFLDEALLEAWELRESFGRNEEGGGEEGEREWWILKPSMSDRGQGIRLFSSEEELREIFEEWEAENPDPDTEDEEEGNADHTIHPPQDHSQPSSPAPDEDPPASTPPLGSSLQREEGPNTGIMTSQLRHFVAQPYIAPLLFPSLGKRKFHIRSYVLAVGALKVYVYREMLALFAAESYIPPGKEREDGNQGGSGERTSGLEGGKLDMRRHLTNTCLQDGTRDGSVLRFWDLPSTSPSTIPSPLPASIPLSTNSSPSPPAPYLQRIFTQILTSTSHLFRAATAQSTTFQPLPNAFEVFGVDWMVDEGGCVWLLEVNAFPDFRQSGEEGRGVVQGFWRGVVGCVGGFWGGRGDGKGVGEVDGDGEERIGMVRVLEMDMGRG